jgi:3-hydroxyisobutyrate dehydrogenase-like beta-hydroxyacid dehydrogenase
MGTALVKAFSDAGIDTHGWSRSKATRDAAANYCHPHDTLQEAIGSADLIVVCLPDYDTSLEAFSAASDDAWAGKTMVQLSSCAPDEAVVMQSWAHERAIAYIDGAIATFPKRIGAPATAIFMSGDRAAYERVKPTLEALGGRNAFVSDKVTGAAAMDLGWLSFLYGVSSGLLQGAAFCRSLGIDPKEFFAAMPSFDPEIKHAAEEYDGMIAADSYQGDQATLAVHVAAMQHLLSSAEQNGLDTRFTEMLVSLYGDAVDRGLGDMEFAAAIKMFLGKTA